MNTWSGEGQDGGGAVSAWSGEDQEGGGVNCERLVW